MSSAGASEITIKIDKLIAIVEKQSEKLENLQVEIAAMQREKSMLSSQIIKNVSSKLEAELIRRLELAFLRSKRQKEIYAMLKPFKWGELRARAIDVLNSLIVPNVGDITLEVTHLMIETRIVPAISAQIGHARHKIKKDVEGKTKQLGRKVIATLDQVFMQGDFMDAFSNVISAGLQKNFQPVYNGSVISSTLIQRFDKSCQQISDTFGNRVNDFMTTYGSRLQPAHKIQLELVQECFNQVATIIAQYCYELTRAMIVVRQEVNEMQSEILEALENQTAATLLQTSPEVSQHNSEETIKLLLFIGQVNKAFNTALMAADLNLLKFTLKNANYETTFHPKCLLEQKVLLSLMQQICFDMNSHNELKQKYLEGALRALDPKDPITSEFAPKVLEDVYKQCRNFMEENLSNLQWGRVRAFCTDVESFLKNFNTN